MAKNIPMKAACIEWGYFCAEAQFLRTGISHILYLNNMLYLMGDVCLCVCVLPQFLDIGGNPREAVDAVHHAVLLNELCAALEDLGNWEKNKKNIEHVITYTPLSASICPVFAELYKVKNRMASLGEERVVCVQATAQGFSDKRLRSSEQIIELWRTFFLEKKKHFCLHDDKRLN